MKTQNFIRTMIISSMGLLTLSAYTQNVDFKKSNFQSQKSELKKAIRSIDCGDELFQAETKGCYAEALNYYLPANQFNPRNAMLNFKIGVCYIHSYDKNLGLFYLENAHKLDSTLDVRLFLYLGEAYQYKSMYKEALYNYTLYKSGLEPEALLLEGDMIDKRILECNAGMTLTSNATITSFDNFTNKVNSSYDEYCPVINGNEDVMAFTSRRNTTTGGKVNPLDYLYFEDIFFTYKDAEKNWDNPVNPGKPLNGKTNDATIELSADGQTITLYKNFGRKDFMCESTKESANWHKPVKLNKRISTRLDHEPSASFSSDRKTLYFVSNKKGGNGGDDIYMSTVDANGNWGDPVNAGNNINTPYDEEAPFLFNDSTLFFSSKGFNSMGGYDIFMTTMQSNGQWTRPVNMGSPLNSPADDLYLIIAEDGEGYLSSNRIEGQGGFDIYHLLFNFNIEELLAEVPPVFIHGRIIDEKTSNGVVAEVNIHDPSGINLVSAGTSDNMGIFLASLPSMKSYDLLIQPEGCDPTSFIKNLQYGTFYHPDFLPGNHDSIARTKISGKINDKNTGKPYQFPINIIDLKTQQIAVRIIPDTNGSFYAELPSAATYKMDIISSSCENNAVVVNQPDNFTTSAINGLKVNIENVYFDFDRTYIRPDATEILNRHSLLFNKYSNWKILISGHTDNMGSEAYNLTLSKKRAQAVANYLISKGVKRHQLKTEWHGYSNPATSNNSNEGRQLNRRCELSVIRD